MVDKSMAQLMDQLSDVISIMNLGTLKMSARNQRKIMRHTWSWKLSTRLYSRNNLIGLILLKKNVKIIMSVMNMELSFATMSR